MVGFGMSELVQACRITPRLVSVSRVGFKFHFRQGGGEYQILNLEALELSAARQCSSAPPPFHAAGARYGEICVCGGLSLSRLQTFLTSVGGERLPDVSLSPLRKTPVVQCRFRALGPSACP